LSAEFRRVVLLVHTFGPARPAALRHAAGPPGRRETSPRTPLWAMRTWRQSR